MLLGVFMVPLSTSLARTDAIGMKKVLTLAFLLFGLHQLSAQTLPFYDLSYYDSSKCIKEVHKRKSSELCKKH